MGGRSSARRSPSRSRTRSAPMRLGSARALARSRSPAPSWDAASRPRGARAFSIARATHSTDRPELCRDMSARARELALRAGEADIAIQALINLGIMGRRDGTPIVDRRDLARSLLLEIDRLPVGPDRDDHRMIGLWILGHAEM